MLECHLVDGEWVLEWILRLKSKKAGITGLA